MRRRTPHRRESVCRGSWTSEEDHKLSDFISLHGPRRWESVALKAGLNRCGKSCRLRWMNYLRPNIKRGNISEQEEDLILRIHKLIGNRWTLIAGRLPGRTDNEIKNYWNTHLRKKMNRNDPSLNKVMQPESFQSSSSIEVDKAVGTGLVGRGDRNTINSSLFRDDDQFFDFAKEDPMNLEWMSRFAEMDDL